MRIGGKEVPPPFEFWVPDYTDFTFPFKSDSNPYTDPEDYEAYLNWLVVHIDKNPFPLNAHQREIMADPVIQDWGAERLGLWLGASSISEYHRFVEPRFEYPDDFLSDPRPERVCDPENVEWNSRYHDDNDELREGMIDLRTYLIFDFMCWEAEKEYEQKRVMLQNGIAIFSDIGWRPLLSVAISRTEKWWEKRKALSLFHDEYAYLSMK